MTDYKQMREQLGKRTCKELREIARAEGICLGYAGSSKRGMVDEIVGQRRYRDMEAAS